MEETVPPKEIRDQAAHAAVVLSAVLPVALCLVLGAGFLAVLLACIWAGFAIGLLAEVKERGATVTPATLCAAARSWRDLLGYSAAGIMLALIILIARAA